MRDYSVLLPISAALLHGAGFVLYNVQTKLGQSKPNPVSWFLWMFLATLNAVSFRALNDPVAALQFTTGSVGCIITFLYVTTIGKFKRPSLGEVLMLVVGMLGIWVWKTSGIKVAYPILVVVIIWSFIPTVWSVWKNPMKEKPMAWWFWTIAFAITSIYTFFWKGGWTMSMCVPIAGTILHGIVPLLSTEERKNTWLVFNQNKLDYLQDQIAAVEANVLTIVAPRTLLSQLRAEEARQKKLLGIV